MSSKNRLNHIWQEIICHAPYTTAGAVAGIIFMLLFKNIGHDSAAKMFSVFHPSHVLLSAMVTTSLFAMHTKKKNLLTYLVIGYFGSIGIATLSDCIIPYMGEEIMGVAVPTHASLHEHGHDEHEAELLVDAHDHEAEGGEHEAEHDHESEVACQDCGEHSQSHGLHLGFIEEWYIVNPAALLGIAIAWFIPRSRYPHAVHILLSTWASSSHMLMNTHADMTAALLFGMFIVLFIAVWLPCCISDIVFPLLFASGDIDVTCRCSGHRHKHEHEDDSSSQEHNHGHGHCDCGHSH